ncbi:hypothetical protein ABII15_38180 [Streptomyces sp. HUAS MG91]|uniref:Uncharacterized protein n=1 Tax=Streptomyces tabacisoli TaxID=3156398 RepID=A0AAU8J4R2_9ACTN
MRRAILRLADLLPLPLRAYAFGLACELLDVVRALLDRTASHIGNGESVRASGECAMRRMA